MKANVREFAGRFFDKSLDFRVRLFNVLAAGGIGISIISLIVNLSISMWVSAAVSLVLAVLSATLLLFTYKTGKYQTGYIVTIVTIFMFFFPVLFFTSGAYTGGMPSVFIFAVLFTILMLEGKRAIFVSLIEIVEYIAISIIAYKNPSLVTWFATEADMLADVLVTTAAVSLSCGAVLFVHIREYEEQRVKLSEQNEQLKLYDETKSTFLTTVAHEIKNPLNAINLHARDTAELLDEHSFDIDTMRQNQ
ncbi:MAG: sensor histidine kinase, partial [Clostridiales bacterium]|nr:sensor histidine kinase [Clostridiales bacterium]